MCVPRLRGKKTVPQTKKSWFANIFYVRVIDKRKKTCYNNKVVDDTAVNAGMAELADALDLGSSVNRRAGSTPVIRIKKGNHNRLPFSFI